MKKEDIEKLVRETPKPVWNGWHPFRSMAEDRIYYERMRFLMNLYRIVE